MPSRRDAVRMNDEEVRRYLEGQRRIILVTNGPDGMPHPVPMNFGLDEDGAILMTSFARAQKVRNLERDPRASLLVESGTIYEKLQAVILYTAVEIVREAERVRSLMQRINASEALADSIDASMSDQVRASIAKRVVLRCTPTSVVSWDHRKLAGLY